MVSFTNKSVLFSENDTGIHNLLDRSLRGPYNQYRHWRTKRKSFALDRRHARLPDHPALKLVAILTLSYKDVLRYRRTVIVTVELDDVRQNRQKFI